MMSIKHLFENEGRDYDVEDTQENIKKRNRIDLTASSIPIVHPPEYGSKRYNADINSIIHCYNSPIFTPKFLKISDSNAEQIFKRYVENLKLDVDLEDVADLCNEFDAIVIELKEFYNRDRPRDELSNLYDGFPWQEINVSKTKSYPSGHTAMGYFVANIIAEMHPDYRADLETIAEMIGQTRIDNGVHFPSDVEFGRYIGELAASKIRGDEVCDKVVKSESEVLDLFKQKAKENPNYISHLAEFIRRSNEIERYPLHYNECLRASKDFVAGYPVENCTDNKYIRSHLSGLRKAASFNAIETIDDIISIHKELGDDVIENDNGAGALRNFIHSSRSGVKYPDPSDIPIEVDKFLQTDFDHPFVKHAHYEWIHPFCDGNGRSGRIILAHDFNFDFTSVLDHIGAEYLPNIISMTGNIADIKF